jgi:hypothetical protein
LTLLSEIEKSEATEDWIHVKCLRELALSSAKDEKFDEALTLIAGATEQADRLWPDSPWIVPWLQFTRDRILAQQGTGKPDVHEIGKYVAAMRDSFGARHPNYAIQLIPAAEFLLRAEQNVDARALLMEAVGILEEKCGTTSPDAEEARRLLVGIN